MKKLFSKARYLLAFVSLVLLGTNVAVADETIFSADVTATANKGFSTGETEITSADATLVGGKMWAVSAQTEDKNLIGKQGSNYYMFCMTNNDTYFKVELETPLAAGDVISAKTYTRTDTELGLFLSTATSRPGSCTTALTIPQADTAGYEDLDSYVVQEGDGLAGETTFNIFRSVGKSVYFNEFKITRVEQTQAATPKISISCFDFTNKNYSMTITATGADEIWYSIDDATETKYDGAVTLTGAEKKVEAYAKANGLGDSEKATEELNLATYDANKKYVAWAYQPDYNTNTLEDDIIYQALAEEYNVVPVGALRTDAPATICPSLASADLLVVTEMMTGAQNFANGLKEYVGQLPIIGLKAYNYTNGRWSWASTDNAPANHAGTKEFLPERNFVLFAGLESDGKIALYTGETSGNTIQTSGLDGTDAPTDIVVMGTTDDDANKNIVAFYSANSKYFGLNLSCDNYKAYHENAATIVAKAAGMLIAGENLAEYVPSSVTATITDAKYATFYAKFDAKIPAGVTAYGTELNSEKTAITLTAIKDGVIPARTAVILYSATADKYTFEEAEEGATEEVKSDLKGTSVEKEIDGKDYVLGNKDGKVGFYHLASGAKVGANQAYLTLPAEAEARVAFIGFDDNTVTAIDAMAAPATAGKAYNLTGVQATPNAKGVVIVDGKKVVIK